MCFCFVFKNLFFWNFSRHFLSIVSLTTFTLLFSSTFSLYFLPLFFPSTFLLYFFYLLSYYTFSHYFLSNFLSTFSHFFFSRLSYCIFSHYLPSLLLLLFSLSTCTIYFLMILSLATFLTLSSFSHYFLSLLFHMTFSRYFLSTFSLRFPPLSVTSFLYTLTTFSHYSILSLLSLTNSLYFLLYFLSLLSPLLLSLFFLVTSSDLPTSDDPHATEKTYLKPYPLLFHLPHLPSDKRGSHQLALVPAGHQVHLTLSFVPPHLSQHTREALPENPFSHLHHLHIPLQQKHNKNTSEITRKTRPKPKDPIQKNPP